MDSNNKRKYIPGILIMTLIFLALSIFAVNNMFKNKEDKDDKTEQVKGSYITLLENKLNVSLVGETEFAVFESIGYDLLVVPKKYANYFKPCFDFVVVKDGIVIKNSTSKEFTKYPLEVGSKITKIGDTKLSGLGYFEILDLIYSNELNVVKKFTLSSGVTFDYTYEKYSNKEDVLVTDNEVTIKLYDISKISRKGIYEKATSYDSVVFDLSNATVSDVNSMKVFMSYFTVGNQELFADPAGVKSLESYKLINAKIVLGNNKDKGVLFMVSALRALDANVTILNLNASLDEYKTYSVLENSDYTIYLYDNTLKTKKIANSGSGVII